MRITAFRNWRIRAKLISVTLFLVLLPLLSVAFLSMDRFSSAIRNAAEDDLEHLVRNVYSMCKVHQEMTQTKVISSLNIARKNLYAHGHWVEIIPEEKVKFRVSDRSAVTDASIVVPALRIGGITISHGTYFVDEVSSLIGGYCAFLQRIEGNKFLCISTSVMETDGTRRVGRLFPSESPLAQEVLSGNKYYGRSAFFGEGVISACEPIYGRDNEVIGALCVGIVEESPSSLKKEVRGIEVGKTGYVYVIDSNGILEIHPAKEGKNILDATDSAGFEYIKAMIKDARSLGEGKVGTIRYPWINPELGETIPRVKINKYVYFKPWDWIIAAGSYEDEIYYSLHNTERFILIIVIVSVGLVFFLTVALSKVVTKPIQGLTAVTTKMAGGDLTQRAKVDREDEIGLLGRSFNRMISQIQNYTSDLEKMVESRTQELKESREKYRDISRFLNSILESSTEYAITALDFYGKIIEFNKGAERLYGWKKEEVLNKENIGITILKEDRDRGIQEIMSKKARKEGACDLEMERLKKDGTTFPAYSTVTAIKDPSGKTTGFVEIVRDFTRRKALERELRETKEFLENVMESSVDGIVTTDLKGKITYLNRAMEALLDYKKEELIGKHISELYVRGIQEARDIMGLLRKNERAENYEMAVKGRDNKGLEILTSVFMISDEDGNVIGTAGIFKDVTEKKRLEADLKEAQANLIEASKMRALGELVAGVAHELNNPLMASKTILHVILKNLPKDFKERERLELIRKCNDRIEKIVEHLREFSRQTKPEFQELDINLPIENALMITGQQLLDHSIAVIRRLTPDLPKIVGDPNQLEQVFLNLISNARDATEEVKGKKELTISSYNVEEGGASFVAASFTDTGVGIAQENLSKIFEPFFTTKPVGRGTGLGLSLCFGIIEAHGGRIEIKSQPGIGTEVVVLIPVKQ